MPPARPVCRPEVVNNPHNQSLSTALQWGLFGVLIPYAMWLSHLLLFAGVGVAGGMMLARRRRRRERSMAGVVTDLAADDRAEQIP
jgi:hypothetical protein